MFPFFHYLQVIDSKIGCKSCFIVSMQFKCEHTIEKSFPFNKLRIERARANQRLKRRRKKPLKTYYKLVKEVHTIQFIVCQSIDSKCIQLIHNWIDESIFYLKKTIFFIYWHYKIDMVLNFSTNPRHSAIIILFDPISNVIWFYSKYHPMKSDRVRASHWWSERNVFFFVSSWKWANIKIILFYLQNLTYIVCC